MDNGNVIQYAGSNPEANRLRMVSPLLQCEAHRLFMDVIQLSEVMCGVAHLHELDLVHGDLKGASSTFISYLLLP